MLINNFDCNTNSEKRNATYLPRFYIAKMQRKPIRPQVRFVNRWFEFVNRKK